MAEPGVNEVTISSSFSARLVKWRVSVGQMVKEGNVLAFYEKLGQSESSKAFITQPKLKSNVNGRVRKLLASEGDVIPSGKPAVLIEQAGICEHKTVMKDLCCDCGADLRKLQGEQDEPSSPISATVSMIHNIPELRVTQDEAEAVGKMDEERLLSTRKLALIVDLDQTLIHTTVELVPADMKGVQHFCLPGHPMWYHTKFRPWAHKFLQKISKFYELHIFTMGSRMYAHTIANMLDPGQTLFAYRIRSRDDCLNAFSKSNDLKALFPCGDSMVCIIDDRVDVWNNAPNLIKVKPYTFFKGVGDINAPIGKQIPPSDDDYEMPSVNVDQPCADKEDSNSEDRKEITGVQEGEATAKDEPKIASDPSEDKSPSLSAGGDDVIPQECDGLPETVPKKIDSETRKKEMILNNVIVKAKDGVQENEKGIDETVKEVSEERKNCELKKGHSALVNGSNNNAAPGKVSTPLEETEDIESKGNEAKSEARGDTEGKKESVENSDKLSKSKARQNDEQSTEERVSNSDARDDTNGKKESLEDSGKLSDSEVKQNDAESTEGGVSNSDARDDTNGKKESLEDSGKLSDSEVKQSDADSTEGGVYKEAKNESSPSTEKEPPQEELPHHHPDDEDDYLLHLEEVLEKIHQTFYSVYDKIKTMSAEDIKKDSNIMKYCTPDGSAPCTKQILKETRSEVLRGVNIVFTGVIPTNIEPEKSDIWQRTVALGAKISNQVVTPKDTRSPGDVTTHVVAARLGTEKAYRAIKTPGIKLVSPQWLWCCEDRWEWVDERLFHIEGIERYKNQIRNQRTPRGTPQNFAPKNEDKQIKATALVDSKGVVSEEKSESSDPFSDSRSRTCSSSSADILMASLHPLLSFSSTEMEAIDKEVEDLMHSDAEESDVIGSISNSSSSTPSSDPSEDESGEVENSATRKRKSVDDDSDVDDVLTKKKKKKDERESDESDDYTRRSSPSDDDGDDNDDDDNMAALLEAELSHY